MRSQAVQSKSEILLSGHFPKCYPFVKWAGGKGQLISQLSKYIPTSFDKYLEPFIGGGAAFFYLVSINRSFNSILSDTNEELVNAYKVIKNSPEEIIKLLKHHEKEYNKSRQEYYYTLRALRPVTGIERAARFITLNKTCYNGLYRVNKKGVFNVPMGRYKNPLICDTQNLRNISTILRNIHLKLIVVDYRKVLIENSSEGDFIYLDPPYSPVSPTANFTGYTNTGFSNEDQRELSEVFKILDQRGCKILLSNSDTPVIRKLYNEFSSFLVQIKANRAINSNASKRTGHSELLIRNYD
ncbi:MAG: DNA adenine methylase [Nitrososphaerota archaeon]